jgi:hypothetical protein
MSAEEAPNMFLVGGLMVEAVPVMDRGHQELVGVPRYYIQALEDLFYAQEQGVGHVTEQVI